MLLVALKDIPGTIQIQPGQSFYEPNDDQREQLLRNGFARPAEAVLVATPEEKPRTYAGKTWDGATVVIIAGGPSLTEEQCDAVAMWACTPAVERRRVIAINTSFRRAPFADVVYACDDVWWKAHAEEVFAAFPNRAQLWTQDRKAAAEYGLQFIASTSARGLSRKPTLIHQGMNSTYQAMNLAYHWGAKRFVLLGVDCRGGHWHGDHPAPMNKALPHKQWMERFAELARDLRAEGVTVVNCSPGTALRAFPTASLDEELAR